MVKGVNNPKLTIPNAIMMNSLYEMVAWCTSVVARQEDGLVIFSRNLDFGFENHMRKIAFNANWVRNGK